ncbi:class I SAM-dependent methyltransferase [Blautia sp. MSJ-19]|uniref:class I SAM-dependent methyltransferase n=1 Tax=Blautia sp. MSJ-19 TaxID=2841517 RepID=UPI001C0EAFC3|nr:class I SAM-dependent methyltransferase [Blautia sp. MSJ-19]
MSDKTLQYYNANAESFATNTFAVDFSQIQQEFLNTLSPGVHILDFGCGSGRDTKYFLEQGYKVDAIDGSSELCKLASAHTGIKVRQMLFQELHVKEKYDGIWACASILHVAKNELPDILQRMYNALKPDGTIYASFKYGDFEGERSGRYFSDFTEESFCNLVKDIHGLVIEKMWITGDVRDGREEEKWLNIILRRKMY